MLLQVVDTVELFHFKRQRKLSLRFLSAYLLHSRIQQGAHDSVEDASAALALFKVCPRWQCYLLCEQHQPVCGLHSCALLQLLCVF